MGVLATASMGAEWMSLREVRRYVTVSDRTLRSWIHTPVDALPAIRVGGRILVRRSELDAWLGRRRLKTLETVDVDAIVKDVLEGLRDGR